MSNFFQDSGYKKLSGLIDSQTIKTVSMYFENKINRGEWRETCKEEKQASRLQYYADPLIEVLLAGCTQEIESQTGLELIPTYSFSRVYQEGEELLPHIDRPSCEISVTVNVACTGKPWPIYTEYAGKMVEHLLEPGDAIIYKGCEVVHRRSPLPKGQLNVQFMLHYVDKNGPYSGYKFDLRNSLGLESTVKKGDLCL